MAKRLKGAPWKVAILTKMRKFGEDSPKVATNLNEMAKSGLLESDYFNETANLAKIRQRLAKIYMR